MIKTLTLGAALVAAAAFLTPASAAPPVPQSGVAAEGAAEGLVQQVHWRHRHRRHYWGYYNYYPRYDYYPRYYGYYGYGDSWRYRHYRRHWRHNYNW